MTIGAPTETSPAERESSGLPEDQDHLTVIHGRLPGDIYVRRPTHLPEPEHDGHEDGYELRPDDGPGVASANVVGRVRRKLIGTPIPSDQEHVERLGVATGLPVFASDNISSSAYATEEIMRVLVLAGVGALWLTLPITFGIVAVLAIVVISYRQTIAAYPSGGGSYIVARDNLGDKAALTAAGALLVDYVLTVAVSIAAGVAALTSLFPALYPHRVLAGVVFVLLIMLGNLRGIRESGAIFAAPAYVYLASMFGLLGYGLFRYLSGTMPHYTAPAGWAAAAGTQGLGLLLILRAFASGSVALTGTEAVSNGVPAFKAPEPRRAQTVLVLMGSSFATIFIGISFLAGHLGILPDPSEEQTIISQLTRTLVGNGPYLYLVQLATALLLVLAANTAFADFPRLLSILARDRFVPRLFSFRGDRLAFTSGIVLLSVLSAILIVVFSGSVTQLIPLYTVGVFVAFTLSQSGMVKHWWKLRGTERKWRRRAVINGIGAVTTGIVAIEVGISKFLLGAWMVLILVPLLIAGMWGIHRHYRRLASAQLPETPLDYTRLRIRPIVPIADLNVPAKQALAFARAVADDDTITLVHVTDKIDDANRLRAEWDQWPHGATHFVVVESPYRSLGGPLVRFLRDEAREHPGATLLVVLPEYVPGRWWEHLLHNQTALRLKAKLLFQPGVFVVSVPYHIAHASEPGSMGARP
ncbi:MAG TPA: APC family permease [Thermomicrobiales bacterium]|nr:APC family permease [Thermomicrobiales bacterium]